ncbi:MAG: hypothetical protein IPP49_20945 [Saprospiraceae bacterium]|nr:hypothetical protein [Saprospiraceae bacterium]
MDTTRPIVWAMNLVLPVCFKIKSNLNKLISTSPWINDYGAFSIFATTEKLVFDENKRASWYSHKAETATPYHYKAYLADYNTTVELAPTRRYLLGSHIIRRTSLFDC